MGLNIPIPDFELHTFTEMFKRQKSMQSLPPITCPLIDKVIGTINGCVGVVESEISRPTADIRKVKQHLKCLKAMVDVMEEIRDHNQSLRMLGIIWYEIASDGVTEIELMSLEAAQQQSSRPRAEQG